MTSPGVNWEGAWAGLALFPGSCGGGGKRAWYTLFVHALSFLGNLHTTPLY